jgi:DNA-binding transcriptional LysR family regulator
MITVKQLQHLLAIIEHKTIHSAADSLHLTHTAVTRSLNNLEEDLGVPLFERSKTGMAPTAFCLQIVESCQQVLLDLGDIKREAEIYRNLSGGELHIAVGRAARGLILRETLPLFHSRYPDITVHISENTPEYLVEGLQNRQLDMVIAGSGSYRDIEGLSVQPLRDIPMSIVARRDHPLTAQAEQALDAFLSYPLVAPTMIGPSHPLSKLLSTQLEGRKENHLPGPSIMCSDYPTIENIMLSSDALSIVPLIEFSRQLQEGSLVAIDIAGQKVNLELSVMEVANRMRSPAAQAFVDICEEHFSTL